MCNTTHFTQVPVQPVTWRKWALYLHRTKKSNQNGLEVAWGLAQCPKCLPGTHKVVSSISSAEKKKKMIRNLM